MEYRCYNERQLMTMTKVGPTATEVETSTGLYIDVSDPKPEKINVQDIAHALSNICRYNGHCQTFYSVAEHAVFVSKRLERKGFSPEIQMIGLHHDDAEAYLGDIPRPIKPMLGEAYKELTAKVDSAIEQALGLEFHGDPLNYASVKEADNWALLVEARHLLRSQGKLWSDVVTHDQPDRIVTPDYWLGGQLPTLAESLYLQRHNELLDVL